jgi:hypothetical protein
MGALIKFGPAVKLDCASAPHRVALACPRWRQDRNLRHFVQIDAFHTANVLIGAGSTAFCCVSIGRR